MDRGRQAGALVAVLATLLWSASAGAAALDISPVRISLSPDTIRGTVNLTNNEDQPVVIEARVFLWTQGPDGDRLSEARETIVVPPVFTLEPGARQVIRAGFRRKPEADRELSYRLILTQVRDQSRKANTVAVALRLSLPMFYTPPGAKADARWSFGLTDSGKLRITLANAGTAHLKVSDLTVARASDPDTSLAADTAFKYVLPGARRDWLLPLDGIAAGTRLMLSARTDTETLELGFEMPAR